MKKAHGTIPQRCCMIHIMNKYIHLYTECDRCDSSGLIFVGKGDSRHPITCTKCYGKKATKELISIDELKELLTNKKEKDMDCKTIKET